MFRKLVSNLPYSPALIADVGFYAKRLRDEEATRRTTVLFVVLALIMQSLAVFSPPESANASSQQDIIRGGVTDLNDFLIRYDHNEDDVKDIYNAAGIMRSEIASARPGTIHATENTYVMSRYGQMSVPTKEVTLSYQRSSGGVGIRYFSPLVSPGGATLNFDGWIGTSAQLGSFGIIKASGSLATNGMPRSLNPATATSISPNKTVSAVDMTQNSSSLETITAKPSDKIAYSLTASNPRTVSLTTTFSVKIDDVLEYGSLIDDGGGTFDENTGMLSWPQVQLAPNESQTRTFVVQLLPSFPATATGQSNPHSFDCKLTIVYGSVLESPVECPAIKGVERILQVLPPLDKGANIAFGLTILGIVAFFYIRTRQLKKEIRLIRHSFNSGTI